MEISVKGRYALATTISIAQQYESGDSITAISISNKLGISKIYLEQVLSLLKKGSIVNSIKGAQGGYSLSRPPRKITVFDILSAVEASLFEKTDKTVSENTPEIENVMQLKIFYEIDETLKTLFESITLYDLVNEVEKNKNSQQFIYHI